MKIFLIWFCVIFLFLTVLGFLRKEHRTLRMLAVFITSMIFSIIYGIITLVIINLIKFFF